MFFNLPFPSKRTVILGYVSASDVLRLLWFPCSSGQSWADGSWTSPLGSKARLWNHLCLLSIPLMCVAEAERRTFCHRWDDVR